MKLLVGTFFAGALAALALTAQAQAAVPTGTWLSQNGGTKVRITDCGGKLCGTVVWLRDPLGADGKPKTDRHNADESKRSRPLIGVPVVQGMAPSGDNKWSGEIYNADDGKTYQAHVTVNGSNAMNVQGCVLGFLCKTQTWTRAD